MSSCAACAVPDAPPSADRRHPHAQLRCCSAYRRAGSLEPTRRRRARAEPRARRSLIAPPTSSTRADRVVVRRVRRPGRTAGRRPTSSSRSASLLLCHRRAGSPRADTTTASARRAASTSFLDRAADLVDARRSCRRAPRAPSRTHRRAPTDVILTFSFVAALPIAAPAHLEPTRRRRARAEPRARRSLIAPPTSSTRADRVVVRRVRRPGRTAGRRPTSSSRSALVAALPIAAPAPLEPPRRRRARAEPRARRSLIAPPTSSTRADRVVVRRVRRPGRTAGRRPTSSSRSASLLLCLSPRRLPSSRHDDGERAPSREHVVP